MWDRRKFLTKIGSIYLNSGTVGDYACYLLFLTFTGDTPINLNISTKTVCLEDVLRPTCTARNTSSIQWRSNIKDNFVLCHRNDPSLRNITVDGIGVTVQTYSNDTSVLICILNIKAGELQSNQQLHFTCENVDIGLSESDTLEVIGKVHTQCQFM